MVKEHRACGKCGIIDNRLQGVGLLMVEWTFSSVLHTRIYRTACRVKPYTVHVLISDIEPTLNRYILMQYAVHFATLNYHLYRNSAHVRT